MVSRLSSSVQLSNSSNRGPAPNGAGNQATGRWPPAPPANPTSVDQQAPPQSNPVAEPSAVGLSDPHLSARRRHQLDVINRLHNLGAQRDIDIPKIVVIGSQSAGKSSLIESISGITLPRASGTCTRCPTECRLEHSDARWQCTVSLRFVVDAAGRFLDSVRNVPFGPVIERPQDVEERLRRAQLAVLNPSQDPQLFLNGTNQNSANESDFTKNCVSVEIKGPDVTDLSFVDLPGLIASVSDGGRDEDVEDVTNLVTSYIANSRCIILLTVTCETDFETQGAYRLAKQHDPKGTRTIGVLTKPDRIPDGEEESWLRLIKDERSVLKNGWFCVKQPSSRELEEGVAFFEARRRGESFFTNRMAWSRLEERFRAKLGSQAVALKLNECLMDEISKRFPELKLELTAILGTTAEELRKLPAPTSKDPLLELMHIIGDFIDDIHKHAEGFSRSISQTHESGNSKVVTERNMFVPLLAAHETFRMAIEASAPNFRPFNRPHSIPTAPQVQKYHENYAYPASPHVSVISEFDASDLVPHIQAAPSIVYQTEPVPVNSEATSQLSQQEAIYLDEVVEHVRKAITRELPGYYPFHVIQDLISRSTDQWEGPAAQLNNTVHSVALRQTRGCINRHFGRYTESGLCLLVSKIMHGYMEKCRVISEERIKWLLELEAHAFTLNTDQLNANRDKILASLNNGQFQHHRYNTVPCEPWNPNHFSLEIMATVRAYFQVASKRVVDMVPLAIDREIVRVQKGALRDVFAEGLKLNNPEAHAHSQMLLAEPAHIVAHRTELQHRLERLSAALEELESVGYGSTRY